MTKRPSTKLAASILNQLRRLARERGDDMQFVLLRHVNERLLYRLAQSDYVDSFVLKGAALFTLWTGGPHRATRDIDLLGFGDASEIRVRDVFRTILSLDVVEDGVTFDLSTMMVSSIREQQEYDGVRIAVTAYLATARVRVQVDVGFGDAITPQALSVDFPTLLNLPAPHLRVYPRETVVAEKLEAMVLLGSANSRMKDFYDVARLARDFSFDGGELARALCATFERRGTQIPQTPPVALTDDFAEDPLKRSQWSGFTRKANVTDLPTLAEAVEEVRRFLAEPLESLARGERFVGTWSPGGPWRS